jgi:hypothetical protein
MMIMIIGVMYIILNLTESEYFDPELRISDENIKLIAESFAEKFAESTFANVISPCWRDGEIKTIDQMVQCVVSYDKYYENILHDTMFDMFRYTKSVEDTYAGFDYVIDSKEEKAFTLMISDAYRAALSTTLDYIKKNRPSDGFDETVFLQIFEKYLKQMLGRAISMLYTWNPVNI